MNDIGSIGAVPVFASVEDIPDALKVPGMTVAVARGNDLYEFFEVRQPVQPAGMGFALAAAAAAGSAGGPVGTLVAVGVSLIPVITKLFGGLFGGGPSAADKSAADEFEQMAAQVTQGFNAIQAKAVITQDDYNAAAQALSILASFAESHKTVDYIKQKWADKNYQPAYESRLAQIQSAASQSAAAGVSQSGMIATSTPAAGGLSMSTLLIIGLLAAVIFMRGA